jgi:hypothetical protein
MSLGGGLESGGVLEHAALRWSGDDCPHGVQQGLGSVLDAVALGVLDEHQAFHDRRSIDSEGRASGPVRQPAHPAPRGVLCALMLSVAVQS